MVQATLVPQAEAYRRTDGLAVVGFVLSFVMAPVGLALSIVALRRLGRSGYGGRALAIAGVVLGTLGSLALTAVVLVLVMTGAAMASHEEAAAEASLKQDLRTASTDMETYFVQNGTYPTSMLDLEDGQSQYSNEISILKSDSDGYCLAAASAEASVWFASRDGISQESCS